jgi:hypothetical protein
VTLAVVLAFAALLMLALLAVLWSRWPAWFKTVLVAGVTGLYFYGHHAVLALLGQPSTELLPERFLLLHAVVEEPSAKSEGAIHLWVNSLGEGAPAVAPRAYKLPYQKGLHSQVEEGLQRGREGGSKQMGVAVTKATAGLGRGGSWLKPGRDEQEIKIRDLPQPQLPEK